MRNAFLAFLVLISTSFCCPAYGQDDTTIEYQSCEPKEVKEDFTKYLPENISPEFYELVENYEKTITQYCTGDNVNVRVEPNLQCEVLGQLYIGTSVEVIAVCNDWTCIGTQDGVAFVASQFLSKTDFLQTYSLVEEDYELIPLGEYKITHYCTEKYEHICSAGTGLTTIGTPVRPGIVSVDPELIPLGSKVMINGKVYSAEDTGGMIKGRIIDMAVDTHEYALECGVYYAEVYLVKE